MLVRMPDTPLLTALITAVVVASYLAILGFRDAHRHHRQLAAHRKALQLVATDGEGSASMHVVSPPPTLGVIDWLRQLGHVHPGNVGAIAVVVLIGLAVSVLLVPDNHPAQPAQSLQAPTPTEAPAGPPAPATPTPPPTDTDTGSPTPPPHTTPAASTTTTEHRYVGHPARTIPARSTTPASSTAADPTSTSASSPPPGCQLPCALVDMLIP